MDRRIERRAPPPTRIQSSGWWRDTLASAEHLEAWVDRVSAPNAALAQLRSSGLWPSEPARSLGAARATYLWVPEGTPLWSAVGLYRRADPQRLRSILIA